MRAGRLSNEERLIILNELGEEAKRRYDKNIKFNPYGYNLKLIMGALQYSPVISNFENHYWIDTGNDELNKIAEYFEYGTGIYNTQFKRDVITSKEKDKPMIFRKPWHGITSMMSVRGVRPLFMMTKAKESINNEREALQREIRFKYGF